MTFLGIHHIRYAVANPERFVQFLLHNFGFQYYANRHGNRTIQSAIAVKHGGVVFIVDKRVEQNTEIEFNNNFKDSFLSGNINYPVDTVCDTCFLCNDVEEIMKRVKSTKVGSCLVHSKVEDDHGTVTYAGIKLPFGNIQHTFIDLSKYSGDFLPGFTLNDKFVTQEKSYLSFIDHLAIAVPTGVSDAAIEWYNYVLGFERLYINNDDLPSEGYQVQHGSMGMRLKAIHGVNMCATKDDFKTDRHIAKEKFVFAEPLSSSIDDQITTFLSEHRGMGIQHIGLGTNNILEAVNHFRQLGASFVTPPIEYYDEQREKIEEIKDLNITSEELCNSGILVESSSDATEVTIPTQTDPWYIMQVFTRNLFIEKTFFLELIQRHHTEGGFGAGNIKALWNGLMAHLEKIKAVEN